MKEDIKSHLNRFQHMQFFLLDTSPSGVGVGGWEETQNWTAQNFLPVLSILGTGHHFWGGQCLVK